MYYLLFRDLINQETTIVSNCVNSVHRGVIVKNYCTSKNITLVQDETEIDAKCVDTNLFSYKVDEFDYIVLDCSKVNSGYIFTGYVEKQPIGYLYIQKYENTTMCLSSLKLQDKKKVLAV